MPKILVIGSANMDYTVRLDRLPQAGETVSGGEFYQAFGGKGANQAVAAARAGAAVRFVARLGRDDNGDAIAGHLADQGIDTAGVRRDPTHSTGVALIVVDHSGNNAIAVAPGSNRQLSAADLERTAVHFEWADILLTQLEIPLPTVEVALRMAKTRGLPTILDPAPAAALSDDILSLVDILTPNTSEAAILTGPAVGDRDAAVQAAEKLVRFGVRNVVVTLGATGACWVGREGAEHFPALSVDAVDATAAGDAFNGALACAVAEGKPLSEAIPFAVAAGAAAVTRKGAQTSIPKREEIERLLGKNAKSSE
jgi:ribokinase